MKNIDSLLIDRDKKEMVMRNKIVPTNKVSILTFCFGFLVFFAVFGFSFKGLAESKPEVTIYYHPS